MREKRCTYTHTHEAHRWMQFRNVYQCNGVHGRIGGNLQVGDVVMYKTHLAADLDAVGVVIYMEERGYACSVAWIGDRREKSTEASMDLQRVDPNDVLTVRS